MAKSTRHIFSSTDRTLNHETGEITHQTSTNVVRFPSEPPFIKLYLDDLSELMQLTAGEKDLLMELVRKIDYDGIISLNAASRKRICARLEIAPKSLRNRLYVMCKKEILLRLDQNEYEANPHLFARGDWKSICERRAAFELRIRYQDGERTVTTEEVPQT